MARIGRARARAPRGAPMAIFVRRARTAMTKGISMRNSAANPVLHPIRTLALSSRPSLESLAHARTLAMSHGGV